MKIPQQHFDMASDRIYLPSGCCLVTKKLNLQIMFYKLKWANFKKYILSFLNILKSWGK